MSDHVYNVARHLTDTRTSRELESIASVMRSLMSQRVRPLINLQNELVDQLTTLEIQLRPYQRQVNETMNHLKTIQYQIDVESEIFAQLVKYKILNCFTTTTYCRLCGFSSILNSS